MDINGVSQRNMSYLFIAILISISLYLVGCGISRASDGDEQLPVAHMVVYVDDVSKNLFIEKLISYFKSKEFKVRVAPTTPDNSYFTMQMTRSDFLVIGGNTLGVGPRERITLGFYKNGESPISKTDIDKMIKEIERMFSGVSGVLFE